MSKQALENRMNFLRTLYCETNSETKEDFRLLNIIRKSLIRLNKKLLLYPNGGASTFKPVKSRVEKMRENDKTRTL